jgi:alginate O-acetyltransferase complex protein AlgI
VLFNSFEYALFLPLVFILYWIIGGQKVKYQNILLLISSYVFYGAWDWRFLSLIFLSSLIDYYAAILIYENNNKTKQKTYLYISIIWNLSVLFTFKYFNFFVSNFIELFGLSESTVVYNTLNIILPVGLSFYTFQTISYSIDVYRKKSTPTHNLIDFLCFVSFFPQLVAGPIERASFLLPQFLNRRKFNYDLSKEGLRQILWGLFKKMVIADNLAVGVNTIFENPDHFQSLELVYALVLFYFQIYCDFSGYADIAIGTAKLFGFKLSKNFNLPYLAVNIPDFWRRWNITLSTWFRDYVHIPFLKSRDRTFANNSLAILITFGLLGFWHGANWTFIFFGLIHALFVIFYRLKLTYFSRRTKLRNTAQKITSISITFALSLLTIAFFRAPTVSISFDILERIFLFIPDDNFKSIIGLNVIFIPMLLILEITLKERDYPLQDIQRYLPRVLRWFIYYTFIYFIIRYGGPKESFIYFQF